MLGDLHSTLNIAVLASPPGAFASLPPDLLPMGFDMTWEIALPQIPSSIDIVAETGLSVPLPITRQREDAQRGLTDARRGFVYYQKTLCGLVMLTLLSMLGIAMVNRSKKPPIAHWSYFRRLWTARSRRHTHRAKYNPWQIAGGIGSAVILQPWLTQMADTATKPLLIFSACCATTGIIVITVSMLYRYRTKQPRGV